DDQRPEHVPDVQAGVREGCVYSAGRGQVRETACDGSGKEKPQYRVAAAAVDRAKCPALTALYVTLGGSEPVGCAVRV
ncbi:hypothetical protein ACWFRM_10765, partial [Streptomyces sp. NPDC055144]